MLNIKDLLSHNLNIFPEYITVGNIFSILTFKYEEVIHITLFNWINIGNLNINFGILLDPLSLVVMVPIGIVTSAVLFYSIDYMRYDPARNRFYVVISIFALFMTLLIVSDNYLIMFIGWELIGVISYLLISFWNTRISAMKSALSAILLNRMGDALFVIFIGTIISLYNSVDFNTIELLTPHTNTTILNLLAIMLLIAATAKSAQLGLHSWLLMAMESPTPVSSLLHAATMVCSGVFVLVRSSYILEYTPSILLVILWLGGITTLVSGLIAVVSNDIKRVIALSTMSQLAMMMIAIGSSSYDLAIYHLYCHAFFKALLFMAAGSIIHSLISETQDMRKFGGLINYLPFSYTTIVIASLSLMAIPGLSGYYSKDIIIESLYGTYTLSGYIMYYIATTSATLTALYSIRLLYLTFFNNPRSNKYTYTIIHESLWMSIPMGILAIYSIFLGYYRDNVIFHLNIGLPHNNSFIDTEFTLPFIIKYLPLILGLSLSLALIYIYEFIYNYHLQGGYNRATFSMTHFITSSHIFRLHIRNYFNQRIYFEQLLNNLIIRNTLKFAGLLNIYMDNGLFRVLGSTGISRLFLFISFKNISSLFFINIFICVIFYLMPI